MIRVNKKVLSKLQNKVDNFEKEIRKATVAAVRTERTFILNLNKYDQLYGAGMKADGAFLPGYRPSTLEYKKAEGQRYKNMTLHNTGQFYSGMGLRTHRDYFEITSKDSKTSMLQMYYGQDIIGLTKKNMYKASLQVRRQIYKNIARYVNSY